ncbi:class I SAM-dependent methyltransferase [bacterium]|nr:class I SAM-dependent methyltransferase [bacterium]
MVGYRTKVAKFYNENQDFVISPFNPFGEISNFGKLVVDLYTDNLKGKKVLDIGCGHGYLLAYLESKGCETFGVDISKNAIEKARKISKKTKYFVLDAREIPLKSEYFDYIFCVEALEHFEDLVAYFREQYRLLKKDGKLIISTPNYFNTAGLLKVLLEMTRVYKKNTFAPFSNWKSQANENMVTVFNVPKRLESVGFEIVDQFTYNTLHGILPFLAISWRFYRWAPIRFIRHQIEKLRGYPFIKLLGMNQIVVCKKN